MKTNMLISTLRVTFIYFVLSFMIAASAQAQSHTYKKVPIKKGGPYDLIQHPENMPEQKDASYFPGTFTHAYANSSHNAAYEVTNDAPEWIRKGVSWEFAEARAWPLSEKEPFNQEVFGEERGLTGITQFYGNALGVTPVEGIIYAESDDYFIYAINAKTGKLIWQTSPIGNTFMGMPLVVDDKVYASAGNVGFNFANVMSYAKTDETIRGGGISYNGIVALDKKNGEFLWFFSTKGGTMPTPAYDKGKLFITAGDGTAYAVDAKTGEKIWETELGGMANMSSPAVMNDMVYVAMSLKAFIYGLDANSGKVIWKGTIPGAANTGMGDVSPAAADGIVIMDAVSDPKKENGKETMNTVVRAYDAKTGTVLWTHEMGRGSKPPAFKGGMPMIHNGVVYVGTPVNSIYQAIDLKTGNVKWTWEVPDAGPAGAGRGPATYYKDALYISTGNSVFAVNPETGKLIGEKHIGGRFGIVNPTIVGGTMYLGNSFDWVIALPVSEVNPNYKQ